MSVGLFEEKVEEVERGEGHSDRGRAREEGRDHFMSLVIEPKRSSRLVMRASFASIAS